MCIQAAIIRAFGAALFAAHFAPADDAGADEPDAHVCAHVAAVAGAHLCPELRAHVAAVAGADADALATAHVAAVESACAGAERCADEAVVDADSGTDCGAVARAEHLCALVSTEPRAHDRAAVRAERAADDRADPFSEPAARLHLLR